MRNKCSIIIVIAILSMSITGCALTTKVSSALDSVTSAISSTIADLTPNGLENTSDMPMSASTRKAVNKANEYKAKNTYIQGVTLDEYKSSSTLTKLFVGVATGHPFDSKKALNTAKEWCNTGYNRQVNTAKEKLAGDSAYQSALADQRSSSVLGLDDNQTKKVFIVGAIVLILLFLLMIRKKQTTVVAVAGAVPKESGPFEKMRVKNKEKLLSHHCAKRGLNPQDIIAKCGSVDSAICYVQALPVTQQPVQQQSTNTAQQ